MLESIRAENEYRRKFCGLVGILAEMIIHHQVAARAVKICLSLACLGVRQQIAEYVGPEFIETFPGNPIGRPAALRVRCENDSATQSILPARQQRVFQIDLENSLRGRLGYEPDVALERGRAFDANAVENFYLLGDDRAECFFDGRRSG